MGKAEALRTALIHAGDALLSSLLAPACACCHAALDAPLGGPICERCWEEVRARLPLLSDKAWFSRVERGFAPGQTAVVYVDNVRRYYEILMWLDSHETLTSQELALPYSLEPTG